MQKQRADSTTSVAPNLLGSPQVDRLGINLEMLRGYIPFLLLLVMMVIGGVVSPVFLTPRNLLNVLWAVSILGIVSMGQTVLLITGNFDLSVANSIGMTGILTVLAQISGVGLLPSVLIGLGGGALVGLLNGLIVVRTKANPFLVTLGMGSFAYAISLVLTQSKVFYPAVPAFLQLGRGMLFGQIPLSVVIFLVGAVLIQAVLQWTVVGRSLYMIGLNPNASHLSGVRVSLIKLLAFVFCGLTAALAGLIIVSRTNATRTVAGQGMEFDSLIAAVLGGTSLFGGTGGAIRTVVGVSVLGIVNNLFILLGVPFEGQQITKGLIFLLVVWVDSRLRRT